MCCSARSLKVSIVTLFFILPVFCDEPVETKAYSEKTLKGDENMKINIRINEYEFTVTLEDNVATRDLVNIMQKGPISIKMKDFSGFEKVGSFGKQIASNDHHINAVPGDIMLYNGDSVVIFYGRNSWSYTPIGKIDNPTNLKNALGSGDVTVVFSLPQL